MANVQAPMVTGSHDAYLWLTTGQHDLDTLRKTCPQAFLEKYIAVTSLDSGPMALTDAEIRAGWQSRNEIAYSPRIQSAEDCRTERSPGGCAGFNEWYVFEGPCDLGQIWHGNVFESSMAPGQVSTFVNFFGFALQNPKMSSLTTLFWKQLDWIQPACYVADGDVLLTFVSRNEGLFDAVRHALSDISPGS